MILSRPLLSPGFYQVHDDQQIARLYVFDQAVKSGQFPVRWVDELGFGFGYPLFVFYPPLVYIVGEIFHLAGAGFIESIKIVFFLSIFLSGVAIYILVRDLWGKLPALVSSLFYILVPYRAVDVYIRGALAESFSFVWPPLILWSFYKLFETKKPQYIYLSAIFLALLVITHNLIFLPFMLIIPLYLAFLILYSKDKKKTILYFLFSIFYSFTLSAFFWIPALFEKKFTIVDDLLLINMADYRIHFVYPRQLWNWPWGFGGSAEGLVDGISFKIGKLHILVSLAAFIMAAVHLVKKKNTQINTKLLVHRSFSEVVVAVFFLLFIFSAFMTTFYSEFIWDIVKPLGYLQFPWRFLTFTALFTSILAGALIYTLRLSILKIVASIVLIVLLLVPNLKLFKPQTYRFNLTDKIATSDEVVKWEVSKTSFEYLPKGVELQKSDLGTNVVKIDKSEVPKDKIEVLQGKTEIVGLKSNPHEISFVAKAQENSKLKANIFNFPTWQVKVNDATVPIQDNNRLKLVTFDIKKGTNEIKIEFKNTKLRIYANLISLFSIIFLLVLITRKWQTSVKI